MKESKACDSLESKTEPPFRADVMDICAITALVKRHMLLLQGWHGWEGVEGAKIKRTSRNGARGMRDGELGVWE